MNDFTTKKLGEVLAFAVLGNETIERSEAVFREALGNELTAHIIEMNDMHAKNIRHLGETNGVSEMLEAKASKTKDKLSKMRDLYLGEKWNDIGELFEWFSFFEGASYGHWMVIKGLAETSENTAMAELAEDGANFHFELLSHVAEELQQIGEGKE